jgi:hypothetical protein
VGNKKAKKFLVYWINKGKSGDIRFTIGENFLILMFRKILYVFGDGGGGGRQNLLVSEKNFWGVVGHNPKKLGKILSAPLIFSFPYAHGCSMKLSC